MPITQRCVTISSSAAQIIAPARHLLRLLRLLRLLHRHHQLILPLQSPSLRLQRMPRSPSRMRNDGNN